MERRGFNVDEFSAHLGETGILKTNQFMVDINYPIGMFAQKPLFQDYLHTWHGLRFQAHTTNFPMTALEVYPVRRYGYGAIEMKPASPKFGQLTVGFVVDKEALVQKFMHEWMKITVNYDFYQTINDQSTTVATQASAGFTDVPMSVYEVSYKSDYAVDIFLNIFNQTGHLARRVRFREAYPIAMPDIPLSWGQLNEFIVLPVIFTFMDWSDMQLHNEAVPLK